jgi:hypothetical protein
MQILKDGALLHVFSSRTRKIWSIFLIAYKTSPFQREAAKRFEDPSTLPRTPPTGEAAGRDTI